VQREGIACKMAGALVPQPVNAKRLELRDSNIKSHTRNIILSSSPLFAIPCRGSRS
jgi:hypothetical protein